MTQHTPELELFLRRIPLFALLAPSDVMDLLRLLRPVELLPGQVLFRQGDPGDALWVLGEGVELTLSAAGAEGGRSVVVAYARQGETVGEMALVDDAPRSATAVVVQGGPAHQIQAVDFQTLRDARVPAAYKVLRQICLELCKKLRATNERIVPGSPRAPAAPPAPPAHRANAEWVEAFPAFRALPEVVKLALAQKLEVVEVEGGTPLFSEGDVADAAWFLLEGEVTVGRNGRTLSTLKAGAMFGLIACIDEGRRSASCLTTGPARLLRLSDRDFDALFAKGNRFAYELVEVVARQLVSHLRDANELLPRPGASQPAPPRPRPVLSEAARRLLEADVLPLELEMEVELQFGADLPSERGSLAPRSGNA